MEKNQEDKTDAAERILGTSLSAEEKSLAPHHGDGISLLHVNETSLSPLLMGGASPPPVDHGTSLTLSPMGVASPLPEDEGSLSPPVGRAILFPSDLNENWLEDYSLFSFGRPIPTNRISSASKVVSADDNSMSSESGGSTNIAPNNLGVKEDTSDESEEASRFVWDQKEEDWHFDDLIKELEGFDSSSSPTAENTTTLPASPDDLLPHHYRDISPIGTPQPWNSVTPALTTSIIMDSKEFGDELKRKLSVIGSKSSLSYVEARAPSQNFSTKHLQDESKFVKAYQYFIKTKDVVEMFFLKLLFCGPPRLGKTTTRRRLIGEILNLLSANESNSVQPSTGVVEFGPDIIVKRLFSGAVVVDEVDWCVLKTLLDEARTLFQILAQRKKTKDDATNSTPAEDMTNFQSLKNRSVSNADVPHIVDIFKKASAQPKFWENVQYLFRAYLRLEDTGGQPELMDMLPALTIGPGLYLLFVNMEWNLKKKFKMCYQHKLGMTTTPEESHITLEEMLLSTLSSISCSSASAKRLRSDEVSNNSDLSEVLESSKSVVYIVGTHKDKVTQEQVNQLDTELQAVIRGTDFFDKGLVRFWSDGKLIVPVDNMSGGVEELKEIKIFLEAAMEKHFKKLKIPAVWLLFSLCFRETEGRTASIERAFSLSSEFNMSVEETNVALWFLHHHAGVLMYFPNIQLLEDLVILDNQIVYDSVTFLILRALSFENVGQAHAEKFRKTGQFVLEDLLASESLVQGGEHIPPEKLIALLEFLHIIVPIRKLQDSHLPTEELVIVYLMPCVLRTASEETLDAMCSDQSRPQFISPLMIRFKCGFVPLGIFQAFIACLISNQDFSLVEKKMKKNMFQFRFEPLQFLVSFLCYPRFYAFVISEESIAEYESHKECVAIRLQVVAALQQVSSHLNYGYLFEYDFAFECPIHPGKDHLCVVGNQFEATKIMKCLQYHNDRKPVRMESVHTVWFGEPQTRCSKTVVATKMSNTTEMPDLKCRTIMRLFRDKFPASDAKKLGTYLDISSAKLQELKQNNSSDAEGFLLDTINYWLENDTEKSWMKLAEAVEDCGHKLLAEEARSLESVSPCAR